MLTLGRDAIAYALAEAQQHQETYHALDCPRCRHVIKIQIAELRRRLPTDYPLPEIPPPAAQPEPQPEPTPEPATPAESVAEEKPVVELPKVPAPVTAGTKAKPALKPARKKTSSTAKPKTIAASKPKKEDKPKSPTKKK
jgi:hypothetical protein